MFSDGKYVKVLMMQKSNGNDLKQVPKLKKSKIENVSKPKLPIILPRCNVFDKKGMLIII